MIGLRSMMAGFPVSGHVLAFDVSTAQDVFW